MTQNFVIVGCWLLSIIIGVLVRQRDSATHQLRYQCMLLSPSKSASDPELSVKHGTTCDVTRHHTYWLLKLSSCRSTCMQTGATVTSAKRGRSTGAEFRAPCAHQFCTTTAALASGQASRHVQDSHTNASDLTKTLCFLSRSTGNI